jgi:hypothetical protein
MMHLAGEIDDLIEPEQLFIYYNHFLSTFFDSDDDAAYIAWLRTFATSQEKLTYSLILSPFSKRSIKKYEPRLPRGVPLAQGNYFLLEHATDYLANALADSPNPIMGYFHFLPPHTPYRTRLDFFRRFIVRSSSRP